MVERLEFHYTPKHGSWLNVAEIEFSTLSRQCLKDRIPDAPTLIREIRAWESDRNNRTIKVDWQFTAANARIKLKRLYPTFYPGQTTRYLLIYLLEFSGAGT